MIHQFFMPVVDAVVGGHGSRLHKFGMGFKQPRCNLIADLLSQQKHLLRFLVGRDSCPFISADVSLLPELIKMGNQTRRRVDRISEGLNDSIVMRFPAGAITGCGKGNGRRLQGGIVGNIQTPVGAETGRLAISQVALDQGKQIRNLIRACLMRY